MIFGTGVDIIEVHRVKEKLERDSGFKERVFSEAEILYCERQVHPEQHFASRFAAKEAFLKAAKIGLKLSYELKNISIISNKTESPEIILENEFKEYIQEKKVKNYHVSLSHLNDMACATVVLES